MIIVSVYDCYMVTHIPTTIINAPSILPIIFDFWYPKKVVVSGVVKGSKKTTIPINTIPAPITKSLLDRTPQSIIKKPIIIPAIKYLIL